MRADECGEVRSRVVRGPHAPPELAKMMIVQWSTEPMCVAADSEFCCETAW